MRRKKVESEPDFIDAIPDLVENEQFVIEDTRKIRKEKTVPIETEPAQIAEPEEPEFEKYEEPGYSETSLAALIYSADEEPLANQFCTVAVRRNPDGMNDRFLNPCSSVLHLPRLVNVELAADRADIEDRVRSEYGGGHYFFQIHYNNRLTASWKTTLADLPEHLRPLKHDADKPEPPALPPASEPVNPFDQFLDTLRRQKEMKDLLFGEDQKRLEAEIERLKGEAAKTPASVEPRSEKLVLLEHALQAANPTLQDRLLTHLFPEPEENSSHWIVDLVKTGFEHKEELAGIAQMLLGGLAPPGPPQSIEAILKQKPPGPPPETEPIEQPLRSSFQRKRVERADVEAEIVIDNDIDSETAGLETEIINDANDTTSD